MPPAPAIVATSLGLAVALWAWYTCWRRMWGLPPARRRLLLALRACLLGLVLAAVLDPVWERGQKRALAPLVAVALDSSASMTDLPVGEESRYAQAQATLRRGPLAEALGRAQVRWFTVGAEARAVASLPQAPSGDQTSDLLGSLSAILRRSYPAPLRACLVVSDGADASGQPPAVLAQLLAAYGVPVYCLGVGDPGPLPDISIQGLVYPRVVTEGDRVTVRALVDAPGFEQTVLQVALTEDGGPAQRRSLSAAAGPRRLEIPLTAGRPGYHRYVLAVEERAGEVTAANNRRHLLIRVEPRRARLLLVEGRPRREYAFLRRLLVRLEDVEVVLVLRKARPAEFWLDAEEPRKLAGISAAGDLERFRAVVLSNIEAGALGQDWLARLARFVRSGGALAMLGGEGAFGAGGYAGGALDGLLPVRISANEGLLANPVRARLRVQGELGRTLQATGIAGWEQLPLLEGMNAVAGVRPGAELVLEAVAGPSALGPLVAAGSAGAGRVVAITVDDTYRWMQSPNASDTSRAAYQALWSSVLGWLLAPRVDQPVVLELDRDSYEAESLITARVHVRDQQDQPVSGAKVTLRVESGAASAELVAEATGTAGLYRALIPAEKVGSVRIVASAALAGRVLGEDRRTVEVVESSREVALGRARPEVLQAIARESGGRYLPIAQAEEMARLLPLQPEVVTTSGSLRPARTSAWLLLVLLVAGLDWLLRRRWAVG